MKMVILLAAVMVVSMSSLAFGLTTEESKIIQKAADSYLSNLPEA